MSRLVIFCENYPAIPSTLYMATQYPHDGPVTLVVTGFRDLFEFYKVINERVFHNSLNLIYFELYPGVTTRGNKIKKAFHLLLDIVRERRYLKEIFNKYFSGMEGCEVVFFSRGYDSYRFYLLKTLRENNKLVYVSHIAPHGPQMRQYTPKNITGLARLLLLKLIYGRDIAMGRLPHSTVFPYMPDEFFKKQVDRIIDWEEKREMMKGFDLSRFKVFDVADYNVMYFHQPIAGTHFCPNSRTFQRELNEIFNILKKHFPEKAIALKYHPGSSTDKDMIKVGDRLPDFIPAEFLYNDNVKIYLSVFSSSLSKVGKGLAVSLIDLVTFGSDKIREQVREMLIQVSDSEIMFPKSLDEFERILSTIVKGRPAISG